MTGNNLKKKQFNSVIEVEEYGTKNKIKLVVYQNLVLDVSEFKHPGP